MLSRFLQNKYHATWDPSENPQAWRGWCNLFLNGGVVVALDKLNELVLGCNKQRWGHVSCATLVQERENWSFDALNTFSCRTPI